MRPILVLITIVLLLTSKISFCQADSIMKNLAKELAVFKPDTSTPPNDRKTYYASKLLNYSGILNVNEALSFQRMEARNKKEQSEEEIAKAEVFFTTGNGYRWLNNAMINIYRNTFSEKELRKLDSFFRKETGKKFVQAFPLIMIKGLLAIQQISALGGLKP